MKRGGILAIASVGTMLAATAAWSDTHSLARAGSWVTFGGTATNGRGVCGISAEPGGRYFGLKFFAGNETFTIQMGTKEWKAENGEKIKVELRFDSNPVWRANGTIFHFEDGDTGMQFSVKRDELDNF